MLWYGVGFLYIMLTLMSHMIDGQRGFGSTVTTIHVSAISGTIPVATREGFGDEGLIYIGNESIRYTGISAMTFGGTTYPAFNVEGGRGYDNTLAAAHHVGSQVFSETTEALNEAVGFRVAETSTIWGVVQYPFQTPGLFAKFVAKAITWDYQYLDGPGFYIKLIFLYPLNMLIAIALINIFKDALSILGVRR